MPKIVEEDAEPPGATKRRFEKLVLKGLGPPRVPENVRSMNLGVENREFQRPSDKGGMMTHSGTERAIPSWNPERLLLSERRI